MEQQMHEWFGRIPKFIITLAADYCEQCNDLEFCALVEHELYHIAQATDDYGAPKFNKETGMPVLKLRGHDVEEFVGVVRVTAPAKTCRKWWMRRTGRRRLLISMLPERAGRAC
jgi:hypothetical protein